MEWNNGKERALFEKEQAKLRKEYLAAGMTEEQVQQMYEFDKAYLNLQQREARHTQHLEFNLSDEENDIETMNPLLKKFLQNFSLKDKHFETERFGWIEQIENKQLYIALNRLSKADKEILTMLLYDGMKQKEIAEQNGVKKAAMSRKISRLKKILKNFL